MRRHAKLFQVGLAILVCCGISYALGQSSESEHRAAEAEKTLTTLPSVNIPKNIGKAPDWRKAWHSVVDFGTMADGKIYHQGFLGTCGILLGADGVPIRPDCRDPRSAFERKDPVEERLNESIERRAEENKRSGEYKNKWFNTGDRALEQMGQAAANQRSFGCCQFAVRPSMKRHFFYAEMCDGYDTPPYYLDLKGNRVKGSAVPFFEDVPSLKSSRCENAHSNP